MFLLALVRTVTSVAVVLLRLQKAQNLTTAQRLAVHFVSFYKASLPWLQSKIVRQLNLRVLNRRPRAVLAALGTLQLGTLGLLLRVDFMYSLPNYYLVHHLHNYRVPWLLVVVAVERGSPSLQETAPTYGSWLLLAKRTPQRYNTDRRTSLQQCTLCSHTSVAGEGPSVALVALTCGST